MSPDQVDRIFNRPRPVLFAHRGGALEEPESTIQAFRHAVGTARADVLEIDVHAIRSRKDGKELEFVVWHGPNLDNVYIELKKGERRRQRIDDYAWDELDGRAWVAPPGWTGPLSDIPQDDDTKLIALDRLLAELPELDKMLPKQDNGYADKVGLNIELKKETFKNDDRAQERVEKVFKAVHPEFDAGRKMVLVSQVQGIVDLLDNYPIPRGASLKEALAPKSVKNWEKRALQTAWFPFASSRGRVRHIQDAGGAVHVFISGLVGLDREPQWPRPSVLFRLLRRGVDGVMTDRPARVRRLIDEWRGGASP